VCVLQRICDSLPKLSCLQRISIRCRNCILLNVIVMNFCMSIMRALLLYLLNVIVMNFCMIIMSDLLLYCIEH
jgi:hypothetical protein